MSSAIIARQIAYSAAFGLVFGLVASFLMTMQSLPAAKLFAETAIPVEGRIWDKSRCSEHQLLSYEYEFRGVRYQGAENARAECTERPTGAPLRVWVSAVDPRESSLQSPSERTQSVTHNIGLGSLLIGIVASLSFHTALALMRQRRGSVTTVR
jgi:hypothetical protein